MRLQVEWGRPVPLIRSKADGLYGVDLEKLDPEPGVYVFARQWGSGFEALYVGKADNIRRRLRGQLNNLRLMNHVQIAKTGKRIVLPGYAVTRPGQRMPTVLTTLERALIRHFLSEGHDLVNKMGARIRRHEIDSIGAPRRFLPSMMYLERSRGN
jgi:hypothetical protein